MLYFSQSASYMRRQLFNLWLARVQAEMSQANRTIYLLIDNCFAHRCTVDEGTKQTVHGLKVVAVPRIWLISLPPNCTSAVQSLDQGIIYSVTSCYRKWYMWWLLTQTMLDPRCIARLPRMKPDLRDGIVCLAEIWQDLPAEIIRNSWACAYIMPQEQAPATNAAEELVAQCLQDTTEMRLLINAILGGDPLLDPLLQQPRFPLIDDGSR